ncbi:hypothetical protein LSG25_17860 [Paralcaligenes sp. KSB-10]|uniref:hypothetical protein n=1 Tax=Paralcaligenes sp. KSB-10 TaxID=2901142 RepID=UPI001E3B8B06|nr:hypothetical protein [Paralcaligenes sp. KSB-10]UHL63874.1 hypothetical protein LSG25_17860 [Paralcaligenes sp. KSB-10]
MSGYTMLVRVWAAPVLLGVLTLFGLLAALLGTGLWHWAAWLALAIPVAVASFFWMAARC